jgi:hypothetical protein
MLILYIRTTTTNAKRILRHGFHTAVPLADQPPDTGGDVVLSVDLPERIVVGYERKKGEWVVPADMVNAQPMTWASSRIGLRARARR